jgi:hypothetical protein
LITPQTLRLGRMAPHSESDKDGDNLNFEIWAAGFVPPQKL